MKDIHWVSNADFEKAIGQFRLQLNGVFDIFKLYGQDIYIPGAKAEVERLAVDLSLRLRGIDKPIDLDTIRRKRK